MIYIYSVYISQSDFNDGTYVISEPGEYILTEDIVFILPEIQSKKYYFHCAILVSAKEVFINLNGFQISQSPKKVVSENFSIIKLTNDAITENEWRVPSCNVEISNGTIGKSIGFGITGSLNQNVILRNVTFSDIIKSAVYFQKAHRLKIFDCVFENESEYFYSVILVENSTRISFNNVKVDYRGIENQNHLKAFEFIQVSNATIKDCAVSILAKSNADTVSAFYFEECSFVRVRDCRVYEITSNSGDILGFNITRNSRDVNVSHCRVGRLVTGIRLDQSAFGPEAIGYRFDHSVQKVFIFDCTAAKQLERFA